MKSPSYVPNATACSLLGFLHDGPMSGWDVYEKAKTVIGDFWSLTRSQVYRELIVLEKHGLIKRGETGKRDRQPFSITPRGQEAFQTWLLQEPAAETIRFPLLMKVTFGAHLDPKKLQEMAQSQRPIHQMRLETYRHHREALRKSKRPDKLSLLATLEFGIRYETMVLRWLADLPTLMAQD